jgi:hypothetical protein
MPVVTAPMRGPARVARKPVAQKQITVPRFFEAMVIEDEYVFRNRPLGGQYGQVDAQGQTYIARQIRHEVQKFINVHEFMAASMFRGGWGLKPYGEDLLPVDKDDVGATLTFDTLVPAGHQAQLNVDGTGNIIDASWALAGTDLVQQFMKLNKVHAARHGAPLRHVWGNGETIRHLFNNTKLQAVGGSVFRIFDSLTGREKNPDEKYPDTGVDIVWRGLPEVTFHVYNQVVNPGLVGEQFTEQFLTAANTTALIPDNEVFITPDPGDWCGLIAGSEPMQYDKNQAPKIATGFDMGRAREIHPPRWDLMFLANQCPVLTEQYAVYNPTVIF